MKQQKPLPLMILAGRTVYLAICELLRVGGEYSPARLSVDELIGLLRAGTTQCVLVSDEAGDLAGITSAIHDSNSSGSGRVMAISSRHDEISIRNLRNLRPRVWCSLLRLTAEKLTEAITCLVLGTRFIAPEIGHLLEKHRTCRTDLFLSRREEHMLAVIGAGLDDEEASRLVAIRPSGVKSHRCNIMRKLDLHHRGQLIRYAIEHGYVQVVEAGAQSAVLRSSLAITPPKALECVVPGHRLLRAIPEQPRSLL